MGLYFKFQLHYVKKINTEIRTQPPKKGLKRAGKFRQDCRLTILAREVHASSPSSQKENVDCFAEYRRKNGLFVRFGLSET